MNKNYILRAGLAFTFLYAGIESLVHPLKLIWFVPQWVTVFHVTTGFVLQAHGIADIALALLIILPYSQNAIRLIAWLMALDLIAIVLAGGLGVFSTTFRDIGLLAIAVYLGVA